MTRPTRSLSAAAARRPWRVALALLAGGVACTASPARGQVPASDVAELRTRAETTGWIETSRYADVVAFLEAVDAASDRAHLTTMGYTMEGRAIPLLVFGDAADASPEAVRASGKLRVYLQGNIHGGEVPGKEALLMLARELAAGEHADWLDDVVLLIAPLYNADGNERVELDNRPRQHGPLGGMGQRPNAMGLDLNRDHMKLDAPEARSLVRMMTGYDPHLSVDLHTTNGTRHAYHVTYSPPLHPGTHPALIELLRGAMLPAITRRIAEEHGMDFYYYGNLSRRGEPGWYTFDHRPRFNNNYVGLRNRLAILSEAYAYLTFEDRVRATKIFVEEIVAYAAGHAPRLRAAVEAADAQSFVGTEQPTRSTFARSDTMVTILMGEVEEERHPWTGDIILRRLPVERPERMWEYGTFRATDTEVAPAAYLIPPELGDLVGRLEAHGLRLETTEADRTLDVVEVFALDSVRTAERAFQDRNEQELFGRWTSARRTVPAGTTVVRVDQPLGRLAFHLIEPRADDGFANWGLLAEALEDTAEYPILRIPPP